MSWNDWEAQVPGGLQGRWGLSRDCAQGRGWGREAGEDGTGLGLRIGSRTPGS